MPLTSVSRDPFFGTHGSRYIESVILPADHDETNDLDCDAGVGEERLNLGEDIGNVS